MFSVKFNFISFSSVYVGLVKATVSALSLVCLANCSLLNESLCTCISGK